VVAVAPSPTLARTEAPCVTSWSHAGTYPPGGLMDGSFVWVLEGDGDGLLYMRFLNSMDTVRQITLAPAAGPFHDGSGREIEIAGVAHFKLTMRGLSRATEMTRDDMKATDRVHGPGIGVQPPIAEARRVETPQRVTRSPDQTEIWIIGVDYPACLAVRTAREADGYETPQPGDNILIVGFEPQPSAPTSPAPSG
jgi:hypothetical protein